MTKMYEPFHDVLSGLPKVEAGSVHAIKYNLLIIARTTTPWQKAMQATLVGDLFFYKEHAG